MAENRLIDANALIKHKRKMSGADFGGEFWDEAVLVSDINNAPTVDAVKVVRCKHCEHCDWYTKIYELTGLIETKYWCSVNKGPAVEVSAEHFCSYGVVKN